MLYRRLGDAGMKVSGIAFGGWLNFDNGKMAQEQARQIIDMAYEQGVNFFDIADVYAGGEAEKQIGSILKRYPRHTLVISTKVYFPMSDEVNDQGLSRKHIMESIDRSLQRINTDYVDIYFCHRPDPETPLLETARAMDDLIHQGKVLYWGTSEWSGAQLQEVCDICERYGLYKPQTEQPQYSMLHRERVESEVVPVALKEGLGLVVWSPLAQGMLTGKYDEGIPDDSRFAQEDWLRERYATEDNRQIVRRLTPIAEKLNITRGQLALTWILHQPAVSSAIVGATRPEQMQENLHAAEIALSDEELKEIASILKA